ncbi:hypothetical protein LS64_002210 [Helicobacter saguini]|nr:hypothetical protein [Helicobacter saguini]TLD95687.1 hypothetical protein LS64_002210 [Helicobacter saguini]
MQINQYENISKEDFENRFNKGAIILSISIFMTTHTPLLVHILVYKLGSSAAKRVLLLLCGSIIGPTGILISITLLLFEIMDFFVYRVQENKKITQAYRLYGAIISIYEKLEYSLASFLNLKNTGFGNLITTQNNNTLTYHLYPNHNEFISTCVYDIISKDILKDTQFKVSLSLQKEMIKNDKYLNNIFEINNIDSKSHIANTQFSTFSIDNIDSADITESSAFQHIKNIFLRFDSFLFVKTSSFSSLLANDILMQSFKTSNQHNPARINKTALFLTNCLHNGVSEYKVQQHIKNTLQNNENIKNNVLFLSAMCRIEKNKLEYIFLKIYNINKNMEKAIDNMRKHTPYILRMDYKYIDAHIKSYKNVKTFFMDKYNDIQLKKDAFIHCDINDIAELFIYILHSSFQWDYFNIMSWDFGNIQQDTNIYQYKIQFQLECQAIITKNYNELLKISLDITKILSYFSNFNFMKLQEYQKEIDNIYKQQRKDIEKYFKEKSNIFYNIDSIKDLCLCVLSRYFYKDSNLELIYEKYQNMQFSKLEKDVKDDNKMEYENILETIIMPLLPLNISMLNCLDENERLLFYEIILNEIKKYKQKYQILDNIIGIYYVNLTVFVILNTKDKSIQDNIRKIYDIQKNTQDIMEAILNGIANISKDSAKNIAKELLKNKYPFITPLINDNIKDVLKDITKALANNLDKNNTYIKELNTLSKHSNKLTYNITAIITKVTIGYVTNKILDKIFPTHISSVSEMRQKAITLLIAINRHTDTPYASCKKGSKYITLPIEITQTLINADIKAMIIGGSPLNSGFCMHSPSVALFHNNEDTAMQTLLQTLRNFMNHNVDINKVGEKGGSAFKDAYCKLWYYLEMGENKQIESYLRNTLYIQPKSCTLHKITHKLLITTKLKISKDSNNKSFLDNNKKENFIEIKYNEKGAIAINRDFLIQLKRIAGWNYEIYKERITPSKSTITKGERQKDYAKNTIPDNWLCGNLIYDKDFIPTTIDIKD